MVHHLTVIFGEEQDSSRRDNYLYERELSRADSLVEETGEEVRGRDKS